MKPIKLKKDNFEILFLLFSLLTYMLLFSLSDIGDSVKNDKTSDLHKHHFEIDNTILSKFYLVPENSSDTILPSKFFSLHVQEIKDHCFCQKTIKHYQNKFLAINHPIPVYKIPLGQYTAIG